MAAISLMLPVAAPAQTSRAGVVTTLHGTATVARTTAPQPTPLKFRDDVYVQDRITTGEESIARILLGGKAVVTIRERSNLTITETATSSTIEMTSGKIALSVDKSRVKSGESVEIKTPNAVAAIRGTIIVAEVDPPSAESPEVSTRFTLLTGVVDVTRIDPASGQVSGPAVVMKPMQALGVTGFTPIATPRPVTRVEADTVVSSFAVRLPDPSPRANTKVIDDQVKEAAKRTTAVGNGVKAPNNDSKASAKGKDKDDTVAVGDDVKAPNNDSKASAKGKDKDDTTAGGKTDTVTGSPGSVTGSVTASMSGGSAAGSGTAVGTGTTGGRAGDVSPGGVIGNGGTIGSGSLVGSGNTLIGGVVDKTPKKQRLP